MGKNSVSLRKLINEEHMNNRFTIGQATDPGIRRKDKPNQDSISLVLPDKAGSKAPLMVLADGMGGYNGGEIASFLVSSAVCDTWRSADITGNDYETLLLECIGNARDAIRRKAGENADLTRMGSTIVLAVLEDSFVHIANVGDSRAYLITAGGKITRLSYDHSFVMEQVRKGIITEEEALCHPRRNVLTMSLSGDPEPIEPFTAKVPWKRGDCIMICSDGLWGCVPEKQIAGVISSLEPQEAAEQLIRIANMNLGPDNISVMIARNGDEPVFESSDITGFDQSVTAGSIPFVKADPEKNGRRKKIITAGITLLLLLAAVLFLLFGTDRAAHSASAADALSLTVTGEPSAGIPG